MFEQNKELLEAVRFAIYKGNFHPNDYNSKEVLDLYNREKNQYTTKARLAIAAYEAVKNKEK